MRREEAPEARLGGLLPGSLFTQCSHNDELVEPKECIEIHNYLKTQLYVKKNKPLAIHA